MIRPILSLAFAMLILNSMIFIHGISLAEAEHPTSGDLDPNLTFNDLIPPIDYDSKGYEGIGKQYPPVSVANECLFYFSHLTNATAWDYGLYVAQWLALRGHEFAGFVYFTNDYPWASYNLTAGWKSGLAQGLAAECFLEAYSYTGNSTFLDLAKKSLMFLTVPIEQGGVRIEERHD